MQIFSHSIELPGLEREAAWEALLRIMHHPEWVVPSCEGSRVSESRASDGRRWLKREKNFGEMTIEDNVCLDPAGHVEIHVAAGPCWPRSWQEIDLEGTEGGVLFRFIYSQEKVQEFDNPRMAELRNEAYRSKDQEIVNLISRLMAAA